MFNYEEFVAARVCFDPFVWSYVRPALPQSIAQRLALEFPTSGLRASVSPEGHYRLRDRTLVDDSHTIGDQGDLSPLWRRFIRALTRDRHRDVLARMTGVDLTGTRLKVRLCEYGADCWMLPHTDRSDRVVTQILYLTKEWSSAWGGALRILRSADATDVVTELLPLWNSTVVFVRSATSYHAVDSVASGVDALRRTVLVQFVRPVVDSGADSVEQG